MNPYRNKSIIELQKKKRSFAVYQTNEIIQSETGEISKRVISKTKNYVKEEYVSLFINTIKEELAKDLSPAGHKLWLILMLAYVDKDSDKIYYHYDDMVCNQKISRTTYYKAINELISFDMIAKHEKANFTYYVNPLFFYNGNRFELLQTFQEEKRGY